MVFGSASTRSMFDGTSVDDGEEPHLPPSLPVNMVMSQGVKPKRAMKVSHAWLKDAAPQQNLGSMLFRPMLPHKQKIGQHIFVVPKVPKMETSGRITCTLLSAQLQH